MYVDGGILDNVPVDAAKELGADIVIDRMYASIKRSRQNPARDLSIFCTVLDLLEYQANKHQLKQPMC